MFAPARRRSPSRPGAVLSRSTIGYFESVDAGYPRFLENPSHTSAPLSLTPVGPSYPRHGGELGAVPTFATVKTPAFREFRGSMTRLRYPLPTLHETCHHAPCKARFRLVAVRGVEPSGFQRRVSATYIASSPPRLNLARRKSPATTGRPVPR
jgi:hypothetical protein